MTKRFSVSIYDFREVADFLNATFDQIKHSNPAYSIRAWAKKLNAGHPSSLTKTMAGIEGRRIPEKTVSNISLALELDVYERAYFELLTIGKGRLSPQTFDLLSDLIKRAAPGLKRDS